MADALTIWRPSSADAIEHDLAALWREAARDGPLSRALMANLVFVQERGEAAARSDAPSQDTLAAEVAQRHPVRGILLDHAPGVEKACGPDAVRIGLQIFGSPTARFGVELIAMHTACAEASIPSIVRRLTRGGVPTAVWWSDDLSRRVPHGPMLSLGRQFLYDSASWQDPREGLRVVARVFGPSRAPDFADLNWRRGAPMRQAIAHGLLSEPGAHALRATGVDIRYGAGHAASALLLAGWFHSCLRWPAVDVPRIEEGEGEALDVTMSGDGWSVNASMSDSLVRVSGSTQPPFELLRRHETDADGIAAELRSLGPDFHLDAAVSAAAVLAQ